MSLQSMGQACTLHGRFSERAALLAAVGGAGVSVAGALLGAGAAGLVAVEPAGQSAGQPLVAQAHGCVSAPQDWPPKAGVTSIEW